MSFEALVEDHHKLTYSDNVGMVAQQKKNPFRRAVSSKPCTGEAHAPKDLLGTAEYNRREDRSRRNFENPLQRSRRWLIRPEAIESGQYLDEEDQLDMAMDPTNELVTAHTIIVERGVADTILGVTKDSNGDFKVTDTGIMGVAVEGKRRDTQNSLPASQYEAAGGTGLTLDKLRAVRKKLKKDEFGMEDDEQIYAAITPEQEDDLLGIAEQAKVNLNAFNIEQLRSGAPTALMGFEWLMTNRLPVDDSGDRLCPVWTASNIVMGVWYDVRGRMWQDGGAGNKPYINTAARVDCVRIQDKGVRIIRCVEP